MDTEYEEDSHKYNYKYTYLFPETKLPGNQHRIISMAKLDEYNRFVAQQSTVDIEFIKRNWDKFSNLTLRNKVITGKGESLADYILKYGEEHIIILHKVVDISNNKLLGYLGYDTKYYRPTMYTLGYLFKAQLDGIKVLNGKVEVDKYLQLKMYPTKMRHPVLKYFAAEFDRVAYKLEDGDTFSYSGYTYKVSHDTLCNKVITAKREQTDKTPLVVFKNQAFGIKIEPILMVSNKGVIFVDSKCGEEIQRLHGLTNKPKLITVDESTVNENLIKKLQLLGQLEERTVILVRTG